MRPLILGDLSKRTQTRSGSGVVFNFVVGCSNISFTRGVAVDQILRISLLSIKIYTRAECKGEAMQNGTRKAYFNFSLAAFDTTTTTSKQNMAPTP